MLWLGSLSGSCSQLQPSEGLTGAETLTFSTVRLAGKFKLAVGRRPSSVAIETTGLLEHPHNVAASFPRARDLTDRKGKVTMSFMTEHSRSHGHF